MIVITKSKSNLYWNKYTHSLPDDNEHMIRPHTMNAPTPSHRITIETTTIQGLLYVNRAARSLIFLSDCISVSSNNHITICGNLPICVLRCWFWNKQWSPSNLSLGREMWVRIHLVHRCFVEFDDVIVRTVSKGINTIFIQISSLYLLLLNPRRLLKKVKSKAFLAKYSSKNTFTHANSVAFTKPYYALSYRLRSLT